MDDDRIKLLLCGQNLSRDRRLSLLLGSKYEVMYVQNLGNIGVILSREKVRLIIFEFSGERKKHLELLKLLKELKSKLPEMIMVVVDGGENVKKNIELLVSGVSDVFPTP